MKKRYSLTLLEIMIVIFLIGLIGSVIGYNMKGSLNEGKAFKTERAAEQIRDVLAMEIAKGVHVDNVVKDPEKYLKNSGIVKNPEKLLKDGWGQDFVIKKKNDGEVSVSSEKYKAYKKSKPKLDDDDKNKTDSSNQELLDEEV